MICLPESFSCDTFVGTDERLSFAERSSIVSLGVDLAWERRRFRSGNVPVDVNVNSHELGLR